MEYNVYAIQRWDLANKRFQYLTIYNDSCRYHLNWKSITLFIDESEANNVLEKMEKKYKYVNHFKVYKIDKTKLCLTQRIWFYRQVALMEEKKYET